MINDLIFSELSKFQPTASEQAFDFNYIMSFQSTGADLSCRKTYPLHVTASGIVLDEADPAVLLVRHAVLKKWVFPGGHLDPGETIVQAAIRETLEETGLDVSALPYELYDVDVHPIPANPRKGEPEHRHADFRFLFRGPIDRTTLNISPESTGFIWAANDQEIAEHWKGRKVLRDKIVEALGRLV